jgi:hypothetical protein
MATYRYWDPVTGHDDTGTGTAALPYATLNKATTGAVGGDEARLAKGPAHTDLGTALWTEGSTTVEFTSAPTLVNGDFIAKTSAGGPGSAETCWEVNTCVGTTVTLYATYPGATGTVSTKKIGTITSGSQTMAGISASEGNPVVVSGGWNLATETQDGESWLCRVGPKDTAGLDNNSQEHVRFEDIGCLRHSYGLGFYYGANADVSNITCNGSAGDGVHVRLVGCELTDIVACGNGAYGINCYESCRQSRFTRLTLDSNANGLYLRRAKQSVYSDVTARRNTNANIMVAYTRDAAIRGATLEHSTYGIYQASGGLGTRNEFTGITATSCTYGVYMDEQCDDNVFSDVIFDSCTTGYYSIRCLGNVLNNAIFTGCGTDRNIVAGQDYAQFPSLLMESYGGVANARRIYYEHGMAEYDTANQPVGLDGCLALTPSSATYYIGTCLLDEAFPAIATASTQLVLSILAKKSVDFNGDVVLEAYVDGKLTDTVVPTLTTSYATYTVTVAGVDIPRSGPCVALRVRVRGTAGSVYLSTFGWA